MKMIKICLLIVSCSLIFAGCNNKEEKKEKQSDAVTLKTKVNEKIIKNEPVAVSLFGKPLYSSKPAEELMQKFYIHKANYEADQENLDKLIWYGRFAAYSGDYSKAIDLFTLGLTKFPEEPRLLRHRGHRYITLRKFDLAIKDLEYATKLIEGAENKIEQDGMPNARNIPVSSLHGNIWYHLGLVYYLKNDMKNASRCYTNCLAALNNNDNLVSATHWLYMITRRMGKKEVAEKYLEKITADLDVVENMAYHRICLFYKGEITREQLIGTGEKASSDDALYYAVGNWYFYNGDKEKAKEIFRKILFKKSWNSFGYIAAEAHYYKEFGKI